MPAPMTRRSPILAGLLAVCVGCQVSTAVTTGTLRIDVSIRPLHSAAADTNGVDIVVDSQAPRHANALLDSLILSAVPVGQHTIRLLSVKPNCALDQPNPLVATVRQDSTTQVILSGTCQ